MHAPRAARTDALKRTLAGVLVAAGIVGCTAESRDPATDVPWPVEPFPTLPTATPVDTERAALGRLLFYDPVLSLDDETACATCHSELWGMADGLALPIGVGGGTLTGPGRTGTAAGSRNAQTLWNVAYRTELFVDGRVQSLEAQALIPLEMPTELGRAPADVVALLRAIPEYAAHFASAFPDDAEPVHETAIALSLAAFQRTLRSSRAPYDAYVTGDTGALSELGRNGMRLFSELACNECHTPPLFESAAYAARGIGDPAIDPGRHAVSAAPADRGAFRVPTLRNAVDTGPYFHDGSIISLRDAVLHEVAQRDGFDTRAVDDDDIDALVEFLEEGLLDISESPDRPESVPSGRPVPRDGFRIPR